MKRPEYRVLFLDIGGVLLSNGWGKQSRMKASQQFGFDFDEMNERHNLVFNLYDSGKISLDYYLETVVFNHPRNFSADEFKKFMFSQSTELPGLLSWLRNWKKDNQVRIISINNEGKELNDYRIRQFELATCFDAFISSCEVKMCKPDPRIFELALSMVHAPAEACIYFDDTLIHVETARKKGIQAYQHESFSITKQRLESISFA
jgi:putative hydrolase of the HAD superfamily